MAENLDNFVIPKTAGGLADPATLQGGPVDGVSVLFDRPFIEQLGMSGTEPACIAKASAITESDRNKTLTVNGVVFTILNVMPFDDAAFVVVKLKV
jgi:hypothetical protein